MTLATLKSLSSIGLPLEYKEGSFLSFLRIGKPFLGTVTSFGLRWTKRKGSGTMRNEKKIKEVLSLTLEKHKVKEAFDKLGSERLDGLDFQDFQALLVEACKISKGVVHFKKTYTGQSELVKVFLGLWWEELNTDKLKKQLGHFYSTFDFRKPWPCFASAFDYKLHAKAFALVSLLRSSFGMGE